MNKSFLILWISILSCELYTQESTPDSTIIRKSKKTVEIRGSKYNTKKITGVEVIDKCELGKLACCNLAESFENSNTVDVTYSDGVTGGREIQMLGLAGVYSQQLIEGTPYQRGILSKIGLELVPGPWIESIGINKGIGSVVNGYENISGQINIDFLKPKKNKELFLNGYISEIAKTDINFSKGFQLNEHLYTNILGHTSFSQTKMDNNHDGFVDMPVFHNFNIMNKWQYFADNGFVLNATVQGTTYESETGQIMAHAEHQFTNPYTIRQRTNSIQALVKTGWELDAVKESSVAILYRWNYANQNGFLSQRMIDNHQIYGNITSIFQTNWKGEHFKIKMGSNHVFNRENEQLDTLLFQKTELVNGIFTEVNLKNDDGSIQAILGIRADYHDKLGFFLSPRASLLFLPTENHVFKLSGGFGFRTPTYLTESFGFLISNRAVKLPSELKAERAFNGGISYKYHYKLFGNLCWIEGSYFLTLFQNQLIIDVETPEKLRLDYLSDQSRAQNFQIENQFVFSKNWSLKLSYKNDQTIAIIQGEQKNIPLLKNDKFLANLYWTSNAKKWRFSTTLLINGSSRIPIMNSSQSSSTMSPIYPIVHGQINYLPHPKMEFYIGSENIFSYTQHDRIQFYQDAKNPLFDAGMIWGPMDMRRMYFGFKLNF